MHDTHTPGNLDGKIEAQIVGLRWGLGALDVPLWKYKLDLQQDSCQFAMNYYQPDAS